MSQATIYSYALLKSISQVNEEEVLAFNLDLTVSQHSLISLLFIY